MKQYQIGRWYQEYHQAKRYLESINREVRAGRLPENHHSIEVNRYKLEESKKQLKRLGIDVNTEEFMRKIQI